MEWDGKGQDGMEWNEMQEKEEKKEPRRWRVAYVSAV